MDQLLGLEFAAERSSANELEDVRSHKWRPVAQETRDMDRETSDETLMLAYRDGDEDAFVKLYRRHEGSLGRYFLRSGCSPMVAEDLSHETWMSLMRSHRNYRVEAKFTTYLYRIAHSRLIDHFRHGKVVPSMDDDFDEMLSRMPSDQDDDPMNVVDQHQRTERLNAAIDLLPNVQRDVFKLRLKKGMTVAKIANTVGIPIETAKSRLRYATAKLANLASSS
jgi:RNA polymerase sigma-70 factor (ECF subfamily)